MKKKKKITTTPVGSILCSCRLHPVTPLDPSRGADGILHRALPRLDPRRNPKGLAGSRLQCSRTGGGDCPVIPTIRPLLFSLSLFSLQTNVT